MKANTDKHIEKFVDKMMKETTLDTPSVDFTAQVMSQVLKIKISQTTVYKPLISKWVWYGIFISMLGLIAYLSFNSSAVSGGLLEKFNLGTLPKDMKYRFNWNFPVMFSPNDPNRLYFQCICGSNELLFHLVCRLRRHRLK